MKPGTPAPITLAGRMPPTRGHDLKLICENAEVAEKMMPPTRGHDLKLSFSAPRRGIINDAPHTGARLETPPPCHSFSAHQMPPTRGHDLKHHAVFCNQPGRWMPPTRGHDLKHRSSAWCTQERSDAPHTGARLETNHTVKKAKGPTGMPPTRGHDLKPYRAGEVSRSKLMPPTRGHDLKHNAWRL